MKKITLSLFAIASSCASMFSQVVLQEGFTSPFNVTASGWATLNLSTTQGTNPNWVQGTSAVFSSYTGGANDFFASNFNSVGAPSGDISNWLFTPVLTIQDGSILQFATRSAAAAANIGPDRLQVRFSTAGASTTIPAGPTSLGTYTSLMLDINPLYSLGTTSAVSNGSVNGYPGTWTVYTLQVTGVPVATTGRFAFRYFVENGGPSGANSNYVGIDDVKYTLPCGPTVQSFTTCQNFNTTLNAVGLPATTYSWSTGATGPSIVVNPASTTVYTLYPFANGSPCPNPVTATITTAASLGVDIAASATNICSGRTVTISALSSATSYSWNSGQVTSVITVTPPVGVTTYSVGAFIGTLPNVCAGGNTISITVIPSPTLSVSQSTNPICAGGSFTLTGSGAQTYTFVFSSFTSASNPLAVNISTTATDGGVGQYIMYGTAPNGCITGGLGDFTIAVTPTIQATASKTIECVNKTVTLTATGGASYQWSQGTTTSTLNPYPVNTGLTAGNKVFTVIGKGVGGCTATAVRSVSVAACTGIENLYGDVSEMTVFPNPFTNDLKVSGFIGRIEIYNALGQAIFNSTVNESETINTSDFAKGVYIIKSYNSEGEVIKSIKLLKN